MPKLAILNRRTVGSRCGPAWDLPRQWLSGITRYKKRVPNQIRKRTSPETPGLLDHRRQRCGNVKEKIDFLFAQRLEAAAGYLGKEHDSYPFGRFAHPPAGRESEVDAPGKHDGGNEQRSEGGL